MPAQNESKHPEPRAPRHLAAMCAGTLVSIEAPAGATKASGGRWRLNAGAEMLLRVEGLNMTDYGYPKPIRAVIDLATAQFDAPRIRALVDHWDAMFAVAGWWIDGTVTATGIEASLEWFKPQSQTAQDATKYVAVARELVEAGDPMEASVGVGPADNVVGPEGWDLVPPGHTVEINGQAYAGDGDYPLYILRNGRVFEASLVLWGADRNTGRLAASRLSDPHHPKERPMALTAARLAALATKHKGHEAVVLAALAAAEDVSDAAVAQAVLEADNKALAAKVADLEAKAAAPAPAPTPAAPAAPAPAAAVPGAQGAALAARASGEAERAPAAAAGAGETDAPDSVPAAMRLLTAEGSKHTGFALKAAALQRWPFLRDTLPKA